MSTATDWFALARRNEPQLNRRQRDILDLLVAGKTNGEIGDALGMTLDGAKWNVSEILGKLGLESREQAAEYWRWRSRPASKVAALRGLLGLGALKWVGGAAAVAVVGVLLVGLLAKGGGSTDASASSSLPPFYLEATETIVRTDTTSVSRFRWWYQDANRFRTEFEHLEPWYKSDVSITVADGSRQASWASAYLEFFRGPVEPLPPYERARPTPVMMIGPAPADSIAGLLGKLSHWGEGSVWFDNGTPVTRPAPPPAREVGHDIVLGRDVVVIEFVNARIWVDPSNMFILKHLSEHFTVEVTRLDDQPQFASELFELEPPANAVVRYVTPLTGPPPAPGTPAPGFVRPLVPSSVAPAVQDAFGLNVPGRFRPGYLPHGFVIHEGSGDSNPGASYREWVARPIDSDGNAIRDGDHVTIGQRDMEELPDVLRRGEPFEVRGQPGFATAGTDRVGLSWLEEGIAIHLETTPELGLSELLRVADGLERVP